MYFDDDSTTIGYLYWCKPGWMGLKNIKDDSDKLSFVGMTLTTLVCMEMLVWQGWPLTA